MKTAFVLLLLLTSCASVPAPVNDFCAIAQPIPNSTRNIPETRKAVDQYNLIGVRLCGW